MRTSRGLPLDPSKLINLIIVDPLWVRRALGNTPTSLVSNSYFGKRPGAADMTVCGSRVGPHVSEKLYYKRFFLTPATRPSPG